MATKKKEIVNRVFDADRVQEIIKKGEYGEILKNYEKIWFSNIKGVRKAGVTYSMSNEEMEEYLKCKLSVQYFAQTYCSIKRDDGSIGPITLRDFQKDIIDLFDNNRFSILMASRQSGKCNSFNSKIIIKKDNQIIDSISIGNLYYQYLEMERNLTFLEKLKYFLYKIYDKLS